MSGGPGGSSADDLSPPVVLSVYGSSVLARSLFGYLLLSVRVRVL